MPQADFRVLVVQDRDDTLEYQKKNIAEVARARELPVTVDGHNLEDDPGPVIDDLRAGRRWYDWLVVDLLLDDLDEDPVNCAGINFIRRLRSEGLFGGYARAAATPRGIRCIAVYSALVGAGNSAQPAVAGELEKLGVRREWLCRPGAIKDLAERICGQLALEGGAEG